MAIFDIFYFSSTHCVWSLKIGFKIQPKPFCCHRMIGLLYKLRYAHQYQFQSSTALYCWNGSNAPDDHDYGERLPIYCLALYTPLGNDFSPFHNNATSYDHWLVSVSYYRCSPHTRAGHFSSDFGYKILCCLCKRGRERERGRKLI